MKAHEPHRISRLYYLPRMLGFALAFACCLFMFYSRAMGWALLPYAALVLLVYPHLAYLHASYARHKKQAELRNLMLDAFLLGSLTAAAGFNLGMTFGLFTSIIINHAMTEGLKGTYRGGLLFAAGCLASIAVLGFRLDPQDNLAITSIWLISVFIYLVRVSTLFAFQNAQLVRVGAEVERKRVLFETLASAGLATASVKGLDAIVSVSLSHMERALPDSCSFGVVLRDPQRTQLVRYSNFRSFSTDEQEQLLATCRDHSLAQLTESGIGDNGLQGIELFPIPLSTPEFECLFLLRGDPRIDSSREIVALFLQQLGGALESHTLTSKLTELANTDALTGLANRARLDARLAEAIDQKRRSPTSDFTVIIADINGLKGVNDGHGHEAGDGLIVAAATVLKGRATDLVARMGGDEFALLCPSTNSDEARVLVERLQKAIANTELSVPGRDGQSIRIPLRISIGLADSMECEAGSVLQLADRRMYADKKAYYGQHGHAARPADA